MRIALVNSEYPLSGGNGGIAAYTITMANALAALGHTVYVCGRTGTQPAGLNPSVKAVVFGHAQGTVMERWYERIAVPGPLRWELGAARALGNTIADLCKTKGLDIVEVPDFGGLGRFLHDPGVPPMVTHFHTPAETVDALNNTALTSLKKRYHRFEEKSILNARGFRCPSNALSTLMSERYGLPLSSITVIRNPVSTTLYDTIKSSHSPARDRIDLLFAGRLEYRKGIDLIAQHIRTILQIDRKIAITFAGAIDPANGPNYRLQIEHSLSDIERERIWFLGPVNRNQLAVLFCRSSMLLFPSIFENAPYVLLEAMASKLPVIAASSGGIPEIIRHGENGLLFPAGDRDALCERIERFIKNPLLARSCAEQGYRDVREWHDPGKIVVETTGFYQVLLNAKQ
ncbi:MAG: glycosyltransferase family 4 protein [Chitinispirillaceae bacterium]|nr:glycosyltransferase family 4 protein [Chitinispirillaceae bacterium]